jgi:hypothetical protein
MNQQVAKLKQASTKMEMEMEPVRPAAAQMLFNETTSRASQVVVCIVIFVRRFVGS